MGTITSAVTEERRRTSSVDFKGKSASKMSFEREEQGCTAYI